MLSMIRRKELKSVNPEQLAVNPKILNLDLQYIASFGVLSWTIAALQWSVSMDSSIKPRILFHISSS